MADKRKYSPVSSTDAAAKDGDNGSKKEKILPQPSLDYVLMSLPVKNPETLYSVWNQHVELVTREKIGRSARFEIPDLPVGTFDTLLSLSDELGRVDTTAESLCHKIISTRLELANASKSPLPHFEVCGVSPAAFMARFIWDEKKFPHKSPLRETVSRIQSLIQRLDSELRTRSTKYTAAERAAAADTRKEATSLVSRNLADVVKPTDVLETEHLTTVFVVVPKSADKEFLNKYETIAESVLPRSAKVLAEDNDNKLYTVCVFKLTEGDLKDRLRELHMVIRDVDLSSLSQESRQDVERRENERKKLENKLILWCQVSFGDAFSAWLHVKAIRIFVESVLRYGLPPVFVSPVLCPAGKSHDLKKTLAQLAKVYEPIIASSQTTIFGSSTKEDESDSFSISGGHQEKLLPFVYSLLHLELSPQNA